MQKFLSDLIKRLSSRKFLLTLGSALTAYGNGQDKAAVAIIAAYVGVEGIVDAVYAWQQGQTARHTQTLQTMAGDTTIVPGGFDVDEDKTVVSGQ